MMHEGKGKDDIMKMLVADFGWGTRPIDGLLAEFKQ